MLPRNTCIILHWLEPERVPSRQTFVQYSVASVQWVAASWLLAGCFSLEFPSPLNLSPHFELGNQGGRP